MVLSMTGFGRSEGIFEGKKISVEIKSLNSKQLDLNLRLAQKYREKEFEIRKTLSDSILRGKADCYITIENTEENSSAKINQDLVENYISQLRKIADDAPNFQYLKMALKMPDVLSTENEEFSENEWIYLKYLISECLAKFNEFRKIEGEALNFDIRENIAEIRENLQSVNPYESERLETVRQRFQNALKDFEADETRFYQEMAFYTEKLDIQEEKVRLAQHLKYYEEVLQKEQQNGKKLGFIAQEMGREINTLGSKANHAEIQKLVVLMKDSLEKIKEQTMNIL
ncbi:YicC family protein [Cruoricaptor ignavus]|uniref:YicC family protein n=1 Tax=Cruoricaptor ignavus TaxID=1118202 RepID=A0A7M1T720_9FLAO|nr:YicC/YloC family endoribonuclease [Cruoricaptor ignavus]QOR74773.1 YicC family protein [Cruoricaptor ignavus]